MNKEYTADDINELSEREHVRLRTPVFLGSTNRTEFNIPILSKTPLAITNVTFVPAVYKAIGEIIDNCLDEFAQISSKQKLLKIIAEPEIGKYTISDNGRGIPIELKKSKGKDTWTPEIALARLRSSRNFIEDKETGVQGMNGVGAACTNFCSTDFEVCIHRDNKRYYQKFTDGVNKISRPKITEIQTKTTGTEISFQLDPLVFGDISLPEQVMYNRAVEIALTNPDITVEYNNEKLRFKKGFHEFIDQITKDNTFTFDLNYEHLKGQIYLIWNEQDSLDEQMFTWINSSFLFDGGKCNTQFLNALFDNILSHLDKEAKKLKIEITRNDIRRNLLIIANLKIKNPEYDSQSKTRLTGPDLRKEFVESISNDWKAFSKTAVTWFENILERAVERHHQQENKKAINNHEKKKRKTIRYDGLLDATGSNRQLCKLLINEGYSAKSQVSEARNPEIIGAYALTGKINNVWGCTPAQALRMGKLTDLLAIIGLTPGKAVNRKDLNYGHIVIATDADEDGNDIFTLLVCLFFQFWPELFDKDQSPIIYRLVAPNVVVSKKEKRIHFTTRSSYEKNKSKYSSWLVEYMKGLGSLSKIDWEMILENDECYIPIVDDGHMTETMELLFGDDANSRKRWLTTTC